MEQNPDLIESSERNKDELIERAIEKATGSNIVEKKKITIGQTNEVYDVKTESGQEAIIRIFSGETSKFETDRWAKEVCKKVGVPVPEVLMIETYEENGKVFHVSVESKLQGVGLNDIPDILQSKKNSKLIDLLHQTGEMLTKIHSIQTNGFGRLDKEGNAKYNSIQELLIQEGDFSTQEILKATTDLNFNSQVIEQGYKILKREAQSYSEITPHLIHNDFAPQHIFVHNNKISGIIDFDNANGADPIFEFSRWNFAYNNEYPLKYIHEGYENKEIFEGDYEKKEALWKIYRSLHSLRYNIQHGKQDKVDRFMKGLEEGIQHLS